MRDVCSRGRFSLCLSRPLRTGVTRASCADDVLKPALCHYFTPLKFMVNVTNTSHDCPKDPFILKSWAKAKNP